MRRTMTMFAPLVLLALAGCSRHSEPVGEAAAATRRVPVAPAPPKPAHAQPAGVSLPADLDVLLITIDSMRADMPWQGYPRPIAPRLTEIEKRAVSYTHAYSLSSYTAMSIGGLLGGRYPGEMKRDGYFFGTYKDELMFPKLLRERGIRTLTGQAHMYFQRGASGFEQGFDVYEVASGLNWDNATDVDVTGEKSVKLAQKILGDPANTSGRFFAWFHMMDPHHQYIRHPEVPSFGNKARDLYDGEIAYTDRNVGKIIDFVAEQPWAARTAIIISSDHGEAFGEHELWRHGFEVWEPVVHVPMFFLLPGIGGRRIDARRSHIDLGPTILDLFGVAPTAEMEGKSLVSEILGREEPEARDIIVDLPRTSDNDRRRALYHDRCKIIAFGDDAYFEVFDLETDPNEERSIEKQDPTRFADMVGRYRAATKAIRDIGPYACRALKGAPKGRGY